MEISTLTCMLWSNPWLEKWNNSWISPPFWEMCVFFFQQNVQIFSYSTTFSAVAQKCIKISSTIRILSASFNISAKSPNLPSPHECVYICCFIASLCSLADLLLHSRCCFICFHSFSRQRSLRADRLTSTTTKNPNKQVIRKPFV